MARKPSQSEDAPSGEGGDAAGKSGSKRTKALMTGAAIGIGSAALVAALLYANRSRKGPKA